ncbi:MAG: type III-B CRISPR module RAMP protein Cmr6 [Deltaproteobacteria bacterium]|nr:type III-B CRISPR module RAMP protein Cmr6 [Deltaproteobacteria bacterium]
MTNGHHNNRRGNRQTGNIAQFPSNLPLPLPQTTEDIIGSDPGAADNFYALYYHYIPRSNDKDWSFTPKDKPLIRNAVLSKGNQRISAEETQEFLQRMCNGYFLKAASPLVYAYSGKTLNQLVTGLGNAAPLEAGLTLHPIYGVPYLKGEGIKGVCRRYALLSIADKTGVPVLGPDDIAKLKRTPLQLLEEALLAKRGQASFYNRIKSAIPPGEFVDSLCPQEEFDKVIDKDGEFFREAFGGREGKGGVEFCDAFPCPNQQNIFDLGITNVHYQDFYRGKAYPADYHDPVPVPFLTVKRDIEFRFFLALQGKEDKWLIDKIENILFDALKEMGFGAKTRTGYGRLDRLVRTSAFEWTS